MPPRENVKYRVSAMTGSPAAAATRTAAGSRSDAVRCVSRIAPSPQKMPMAFQ